MAARMTAPIRRTWIKPPRWVGFCNDGYGLGSDGKWYFQQRPPELDRLRQFREMQFDTITRTVGEVVDEWLAAGKLPFLLGTARAEAMTETKAALQRLPRALLKAIVKAGGKVIVEPEPYLPTSSIFGDDSGRAAGLTTDKSARVAGRCGDVGRVVLHETGHVIDNCRGRWAISRGRESARRLERGEGRRPRPERRRLSLATLAARVFCGVFRGILWQRCRRPVASGRAIHGVFGNKVRVSRLATRPAALPFWARGRGLLARTDNTAA